MICDIKQTKKRFFKPAVINAYVTSQEQNGLDGINGIKIPHYEKVSKASNLQRMLQRFCVHRRCSDLIRLEARQLFNSSFLGPIYTKSKLERKRKRLKNNSEAQ